MTVHYLILLCSCQQQRRAHLYMLFFFVSGQLFLHHLQDNWLQQGPWVPTGTTVTYRASRTP